MGGGNYLRVTLTLALTGEKKKKGWTDPAGWVGPQPHYVKSNGRSIDCRTTVVVWVWAWGIFLHKRGGIIGGSGGGRGRGRGRGLVRGGRR